MTPAWVLLALAVIVSGFALVAVTRDPIRAVWLLAAVFVLVCTAFIPVIQRGQG
jgi:drug/metabolite transporter superfamily protein YnfA